MLSISPQQTLNLSQPEINIHPMTLNNDLAVVYLDYPVNNFQAKQASPVNPQHYSNGFSKEINPMFNSFQNDYTSPFPPSSSNFSFPNSQPLHQPPLSHQSLQTSLFSCRQHKTKWTFDEDVRLKEAVEKFGTDSWIRISQFVPGRNSKQCRERWMGQLAPSIRKDSWSREEDEILMQQHELIGNKWTTIATLLPGRSAINVKNRWSKIKRIKEDILDCTNSKSIRNQNSKDNYNYNYSIDQSNSEMLPSKRNLSNHHKKLSHKSNKFKNTKQISTSSKKHLKAKKNIDHLYTHHDNVENPQTNNTQNPEVAKEKSQSIVFQFPEIDNLNLFGQRFAHFQEQMLK